ncbi:MAG: hypothetical protein ACYTBJ_01570 [Planctomycetota bacterium]|jgi:Rod binding domain-containing protein
MDTSNLMLTGAVSPPIPLDGLVRAPSCKAIANGSGDEIDVLAEDDKKRVARDFESVLIGKLMDEMKSTIGDWGFEQDGAAEQVQGMFWLFLSRHVADNGGVGIWKDVYKFLTKSAGAGTPAETLDNSL